MEASSEAPCATTCCCPQTKQKSQPLCCFRKTRRRKTRPSTHLHRPTQRKITENNLFVSIAATRGVNVRSNFVAAPQLCAQTCWDLQGARCLCFVSLLPRHRCAHRPGTFHSLSELKPATPTTQDRGHPLV